MVPLRGPRECHRAGTLIVVSNPQSQMCRDMKWGVRRGRERGGKFSGKVTGTNFLPRAEEEHSPESRVSECAGDLTESLSDTLGLQGGQARLAGDPGVPQRICYLGRPFLASSL